MLSRTADNLYWLARYMERADYLARVVTVTQRMATLPRVEDGVDFSEWKSALISSGAHEAFAATDQEQTDETILEFLTFDPRNPSSIRNCVEQARQNARAVRTALTMEAWDAINAGWLELKRFDERRADGALSPEAMAQFLDVVKRMALMFEGSAYRTMLRHDTYYFSRLGLNIERADNTARILDVKYHVLLPQEESIGGSLDYFQWASILRAVSALTAYHWVYRESVKPWLVADLLILRPQMPRSLVACYGTIARYLDELGRAYGRHGVAQRQARQMLSRLQQMRVEQVFQGGLHEFVTDFIEQNQRIGGSIAAQYLL